MFEQIAGLPERIHERIDTTGACWIWTGATDKDGYGLTSIEGRTYRVHRLVFALFRGPIQDGLVLDHLCRNRGCCNPEHLEAVTNRENRRRGMGEALKQTCANGHPWTPENIYDPPGRGRRACLICKRRRWHEWKERSRA